MRAYASVLLTLSIELYPGMNSRSAEVRAPLLSALIRYPFLCAD